MAKKKSKTISTKGWKSNQEKKAESRVIHIEKTIPHGISQETQAYAKSIAGIQNAKELESSTKNPKGRKISKVNCNKIKQLYNNGGNYKDL